MNEKMNAQNVTTSLHLLCIGVDPAFIGYILTKPEAANFSLDACRSLQDARQKITSTPYDVYIIDFSLLDASAFALIQEIRKQETKKSTIAVILDSPPEENYLRILKEDKKIDCILEKPNIQQHIDLMFQGIVEGHAVKDKLLPSKSRLSELKRKYDESIGEKIALLTKLTKSAQQNPALIEELKAAVHKISGNAGSYGYGSVSTLCKAMQIEINNRLAAGTHKDVQWLSSLDEFIKKVTKGFQTSSFDGSSLTLKPSIVEKTLLFVVDDDVKFLELLERVKEAFSIELAVEFDPQKAIERLHSADFNPHGIIVSQTFRSSSITGLDIIQVQVKKNMSSPPITALLLERDNIDDRLEAMQKGSTYAFCKPISAYLLLKTMTEALEFKPLALKVMIVDDDPDFCNYVSAVLTDIGISTCIINEPTDLFNKLDEFRPNIMLLDIMFSKYDGLNLLKTLRQDINYRNLIIVVVTSNEQLDTRINAYAANADDILFKPIDTNVLQRRILSIASRRISSQEPADNYTGLLHLQELMDALNETLKKSGRLEPYLALFEVHKFADWTKENGYVPARDLMISISNQLQWETDNRMKCFWYKASIFAIVFEDMEYDMIEKKMFNFLTHLVQSEPRWHFSFDCGIVPISKSFVNASKVLQTAEESLYEASNKEAAPVKIVHRLPKGELDIKKEVMIVDPDRDLLKILKQAFESHGLVVSTYYEGGDALKELLARTENRLPSLIIVERKLPDMDGMDLYLKLKIRFRTTIPCFMLTVFSADKDISEGIKQGVLEYIIKPFNITILIQKALQAVFKS